MTVPDDLDLRDREAAARSGMPDAGYDLVESPLGPLLVAASNRGLLRISFGEEIEQHLEKLARIAGHTILRTPRRVDGARRELDEYFEGRRHAFDLTVDLGVVTPFTKRVLAELARIPFGATVTYGELAARAGYPRAARAVGMTMNRNRTPVVLPCHRVIGANGSLVGYAGGLDRKVALLTLEGATVHLDTLGQRAATRAAGTPCPRR